MATKQQLELEVMDLRADVQLLLEVARNVIRAGDAVDFSDEVGDNSPAFTIGRMVGMARYSTIGLRSVRWSEEIADAVSAPAGQV